MTTVYENDFAAWAEEQAARLREHAANALDYDNLADEIEDLSRREKHAIRSRLQLICQHLLKWSYQPEHQSRSWRATILVQRRDLEDDILSESPSLRPYAAGVLSASYVKGRIKAEDETGLLHLPAECPWTIEQVLDLAFWPGGSEL